MMELSNEQQYSTRIRREISAADSSAVNFNPNAPPAENEVVEIGALNNRPVKVDDDAAINALDDLRVDKIELVKGGGTTYIGTANGGIWKTL